MKRMFAAVLALGLSCLSMGRALGYTPGPIINVLDYGALGNGSHDDGPAFNAAAAAAAAANASVYVPYTTSFYSISTPITIPQNASLRCDDGVKIETAASMTSLITVTANSGAVIRGRCVLVNNSSEATYAVTLNPTNIGNNYNTVQDVAAYGFKDAFHSVSGDGWTFRNVFAQNSTCWDVKSDDDGTNSLIDGLRGLGSGGGTSCDGGGSGGAIYYAHSTYHIEGVKVVNTSDLATGGQGVRMDGAFVPVFENDLFDQLNGPGIELNGDTGYAVDGVSLTNVWVGVGVGATKASYGIYAHGNVNDLTIIGGQSAGFGCGIELANDSFGVFQRGFISGWYGIASSTADICTTSYSSAAPIGIVANGNHLESTVASVSESAGTVGYYTNNHFYSASSKSPNSIYYANFGDDLYYGTGKWAAWATYAPTISCVSGSIGTNTAIGHFFRTANLANVEIRLAITSIGTCTGPITLSLPYQVNASITPILSGREVFTGHALQGIANQGTSTVTIVDYAGNSIGGNGETILISGPYEAAP